MIRIRVKFFGPFRELFGGREKAIDFPGEAPVRRLLGMLCDTRERERQTYSDANGLSPGVVVMINGQPVPATGGLETPLRNGDIVAVFPFLGGG